MITGRHSGQDFDALADLFLLDGPSVQRAPDAPATGIAEPETGRGLRILALALGHLPTISGPWAGQFATALAAEHGAPVGIIRLGGGSAQVDLHGGAGAERPTLREALDEVASRAAFVLVRVDEIDEPDLLDADGLDGAVVLSGVDDASLVGAYRLIKRLVAGRGERPAPTLLAGFIGAGPEAASNAHGRLARASLAHAGVEIGRTCSIERMVAARGTTLHRGPCEADLGEIISMLRSAARDPETGHGRGDPAPTIPDRAPSLTVGPAPGPVRHEPFGAWPAWQDLLGPAGEAFVPAPEHAICERDAGEPIALEADALLERVSGVHPLPLECPCAPGVAIGVDTAGMIHVAAVDRDAGMLLAAASWAREHADWIAAAAGRPRPGGVALRLFTQRPAAWRGLLGGDVRVHPLGRDGAPSPALNEPCPARSGA